MSRRAKIETMLKANPDDAFLLYALALELLKEGDQAAGIEQLKRVASKHPDYHAAYFQLGQTLVASGEVDEAREWLEQGVSAAHRAGDTHAAGEMEELLMTL